MWDIVRATGIVTWILLMASVAVGTMFSGRQLPPRTQKTTLALHRSLSWLAVAFTVFHGGSLLLADEPWSVGEILLPLGLSGDSLFAAFGILAAYSMLAVTASFYLRRRLAGKTWRAIHMSAYGTFMAGWIHSVAMGTDTASPLMRGIYIGSFVLILLLALQRALAATAPVPPARAAAATSDRRVP